MAGSPRGMHMLYVCNSQSRIFAGKREWLHTKYYRVELKWTSIIITAEYLSSSSPAFIPPLLLTITLHMRCSTLLKSPPPNPLHHQFYPHEEAKRPL
jgi:hypothetical protein